MQCPWCPPQERAARRWLRAQAARRHRNVPSAAVHGGLRDVQSLSVTSVITLLTDYGLEDGYVAACHGVIAGIAPPRSG
ncbi:SAM-dependent chlorinase/fluorinase [Nonomuraea ferruginea]